MVITVQLGFLFDVFISATHSCRGGTSLYIDKGKPQRFSREAFESLWHTEITDLSVIYIEYKGMCPHGKSGWQRQRQ